MFRLCRLALVVCSLVANITSNFSNSLANNTTFSVEAGGFCQATLFGAKLFHTCLQAHQARKKQRGAAPRKRVKNLGQSVSLEHQSGAEGARKKKTTFQAPKSCFSKRQLQANETAILATSALGLLLFPGVKAKNGLIRSGKKTTFQAPKSCFFGTLWMTLFALKTGYINFVDQLEWACG